MISDRTAPDLRSPYDRNLPDGYWEELEKPRPAQRPAPAAPARAWILALGALLVGCLCVTLVNHKSPSAAVKSEVTSAGNFVPVPTPVPTRTVPRAEPVIGPMTSVGTPMLSGSQYYVAMPDGRHLLVNYRGWIDHACNLPRQPKGGANNAMYTDQATGINWIWTVPVGTSNVPRWIDP